MAEMKEKLKKFLHYLMLGGCFPEGLNLEKVVSDYLEYEKYQAKPPKKSGFPLVFSENTQKKAVLGVDFVDPANEFVSF